MPDLVFRFHGLKIVSRNCPLLVTNPHSASEHDKKRYDGKEASLTLTCAAHYEAVGTTSLNRDSMWLHCILDRRIWTQFPEQRSTSFTCKSPKWAVRFFFTEVPDLGVTGLKWDFVTRHASHRFGHAWVAERCFTLTKPSISVRSLFLYPYLFSISRF